MHMQQKDNIYIRNQQETKENLQNFEQERECQQYEASNDNI